MTNFSKRLRKYMISSKEQMTKFKGEICDYALNFLKEHSGYRWSDVLDYICDKMDLDTEFEDIIQSQCKFLNSTLEKIFIQATTDTEVHSFGLTKFTAFGNLVGVELRKRFDEHLKKEL